MVGASVVDLYAERVAREARAFDEARRALSLAQSSGSLKDMARAVEAFDRFMRLAGLTEAERREVLGP